MSKVVPVRKTNRVVNKLSQAEMAARSRDDLVRLVSRLYRQGMSAEEVKEWFVESLPQAMHSVALRKR
jgi:phage regulator Rha-like protein